MNTGSDWARAADTMIMTMPRQFIQGTTYFITRRCTQRQFWLKPTPRNIEIFGYCLAVAAGKFGVQIHSVCVMSNQYHMIVTDPENHVAEFYGWLHKYVAKAINVSCGRLENLWSSEKTSVIPLRSEKDVLDKTVYTLANPVQAHLVALGKNWPGIWLFQPGKQQVFNRPDVYFSDDGDMPKKATLTIAKSPQSSAQNDTAYVEQIETLLFLREQKIVAKMIECGESFLGIRGVLDQPQSASPKNQEPRQEITPRVAAKDKWLRIESILRNKEFLSEYAKARQRWKSGDKDVEFPLGTYALRIHANVRCASG